MELGFRRDGKTFSLHPCHTSFDVCQGPTLGAARGAIKGYRSAGKEIRRIGEVHNTVIQAVSNVERPAVRLEVNLGAAAAVTDIKIDGFVACSKAIRSGESVRRDARNDGELNLTGEREVRLRGHECRSAGGNRGADNCDSSDIHLNRIGSRKGYAINPAFIHSPLVCPAQFAK